MNWVDYIYWYVPANFDIELLIAKQEAVVDIDNIKQVCNYIKFPIAENGNLINKGILENLIDTIKYDKAACKHIFGNEDTNINLYKDDNCWYIYWNNYNLNDFENLSDDEIKKLYKYC